MQWVIDGPIYREPLLDGTNVLIQFLKLCKKQVLLYIAERLAVHKLSYQDAAEEVQIDRDRCDIQVSGSM
jgi:hypothetical protein